METRYHIVSGRFAGDMDPSLTVTVAEFMACCDALNWPRPQLVPVRADAQEYYDADSGELILRATELPTVVCQRCGHTWHPRRNSRPARCANPKCRSPYWNTMRTGEN